MANGYLTSGVLASPSSFRLVTDQGPWIGGIARLRFQPATLASSLRPRRSGAPLGCWGLSGRRVILLALTHASSTHCADDSEDSGSDRLREPAPRPDHSGEVRVGLTEDGKQNAKTPRIVSCNFAGS